MKKYYKNIGIVLAVLFFTITAGLMTHLALAGTLTSAYDRLNRVQAGLTTGVIHNIVFTPATTVTGGSGFSILMLQFPVSDATKWCHTAGAGTAAVDTENGATGLPGTTLSSSCTQGNGTTSGDTLLACATGGTPTWTAATLYGVTLSGSTDVLGTDAAATNNIVVSLTTGTSTTCTSTFTGIDTGSIALSTLSSDQVAVTATVPPLLTFSVSGASVGFGTLNTTNAYYATIAGTGSTTEPTAASSTGVTISTNAPNGLIIAASDSGNGVSSAGLYKSATPTHLIAATNANAVTAGTEGYGLFVDNVSNLTAATGFGAGKTSATTAITTAAQTVLTAAGAVSSGTASVDLVAAMSSITPAGSYSDSITLTGTGKF